MENEDSLKHDSTLMLDYNRKLLLRLIRKYEKISKADLTKLTKLSPTTVGRIINTLIDEDILKEVGVSGPGLGRKAKLLSINSRAKYAIGINVDTHIITGGIVDLNGKIFSHSTVSVSDSSNYIEIVDLIYKTFLQLIQSIDPETEKKIIGIGISFTGNIQQPEGIVRFSPQMKWTNVNIKDLISKRINNFPVYVENNVKSSATAEILFGHGKIYNDFVVIHAGSGIGGAVVTNSSVNHGENGMLGEIGHVIIHPNGRICDCGRRGCIQAYACIPSLEKEAGIPFEQILSKADNGDSICASLISEAVDYISLLVSNIINMYDPPLILLTGEMFDTIIDLADKVKERFEYYMWKGPIKKTNIEKSTLSHADNMIISAASIVFQECLFSSLVAIG